MQLEAAERHGHSGLQWLIAQDEAERSAWVDRFRNSDMTLGEVIQLSLIQREAVWASPVQQQPYQQRSDRGQEQRVPKPRMKVKGSKGKGKGSGSGKGEGKYGPGKAKHTVESRARLCIAYNQGKCWNKNCEKGQHRCSAHLGHGRYCGQPHPAVQCNNPNKKL